LRCARASAGGLHNSPPTIPASYNKNSQTPPTKSGPPSTPHRPPSASKISYQLHKLQNPKNWITSEHGQTLHSVQYNPIQWKNWYKLLDRSSVTSISRFLSDHFPSRTYLHRFALSISDICRFSNKSPESPEHLLLTCPNILTDSTPYHPIFGPNPTSPTITTSNFALSLPNPNHRISNTTT